MISAVQVWAGSREELVEDRGKHLDEFLVREIFDMGGTTHQRVEVTKYTHTYLDSMLNTTFILEIYTHRASANRLSTIYRITLALTRK